MKAAIIGALAVTALAGCVNVVKYSPLAPTSENIRSSVAAGALIRSPGPGRGTIQLCLGDGSARLVRNAEVSRDQVCWRYQQSNADFRQSSKTVVECTPLTEVVAVGRPRDARVVGYYPVSVPMRCPTP